MIPAPFARSPSVVGLRTLMRTSKLIRMGTGGYAEKRVKRVLPSALTASRMGHPPALDSEAVKSAFSSGLQPPYFLIFSSFRGKNWLSQLQRREELDYPAGQAPTSLHIRIAFHGHVQMRVGFKDVQWSETLETATLKLCSYLQRRILECC